MPEVVICPSCRRKSRVPDELLGKKVKCPGCGETFPAVVDAPAPKNGEAKGGDDLEVMTEPDDKGKIRQSRVDDEEDDRSRSRRTREDDDERPRRGGKRSDREEDDDEDERPRRGKRSDREEDEGERPRRAAPPGQGGTDTFGIISVVIGGVSLAMLPVGCCCGILWFAAVPMAIVGGALGCWGRGPLRIIGLSLNILAFLPGAVLSVILIIGVTLPAVMGGPNGPGGPGNGPFGPRPGIPGRR